MSNITNSIIEVNNDGTFMLHVYNAVLHSVGDSCYYVHTGEQDYYRWYNGEIDMFKNCLFYTNADQAFEKWFSYIGYEIHPNLWKRFGTHHICISTKHEFTSVVDFTTTEPSFRKLAFRLHRNGFNFLGVI